MKNRLRWHEQVRRRDDSHMSRTVLDMELEGVRPRGRQTLRYMDTIGRGSKRNGLTDVNILDLNNWRMAVSSMTHWRGRAFKVRRWELRGHTWSTETVGRRAARVATSGRRESWDDPPPAPTSSRFRWASWRRDRRPDRTAWICSVSPPSRVGGWGYLTHHSILRWTWRTSAAWYNIHDTRDVILHRLVLRH